MGCGWPHITPGFSHLQHSRTCIMLCQIVIALLVLTCMTVNGEGSELSQTNTAPSTLPPLEGGQDTSKVPQANLPKRRKKVLMDPPGIGNETVQDASPSITSSSTSTERLQLMSDAHAPSALKVLPAEVKTDPANGSAIHLTKALTPTNQSAQASYFITGKISSAVNEPNATASKTSNTDMALKKLNQSIPEPTELKQRKSKPITFDVDDTPKDPSGNILISQEGIVSSDPATDYVVPIVFAMLAIPLAAVIAAFVYKKGRDFWDRRHYRRMDFLIDGMYND